MIERTTRRGFLKGAGLGLFTVAAPLGAAAGLLLPRGAGKRTLFVGTYTTGKSRGIYRCRMDPSSGALQIEAATDGVPNPSFLAIDRRQGRLFAVNETDQFEGARAGSVSAFSLDVRTGDLRFLNRRSSRGPNPCHLVLDRGARHVLVANYSGGSVAVLPVEKGGSLGEATCLVQHEGSSANASRQEAPHAHHVAFDLAGRFAYAVDLGIDKVMIYRFDGQKGTLVPATPPWSALQPGAGPRHMAFHPDGRHAYLITELDSTITLFNVDRSTGALNPQQTVSTLPAGFTGENFPADIHLSPSGTFLYGSNRGHDSIVVFAVHRKTGELSLLQHQPTEGSWPRNFVVDPDGQFLLVANQRSDSIVVFSIDPVRGTLASAGQKLEIPAPVCLKFL